MIVLESYLEGKWVGGDAKKGATLVNPATEEPLARCSTEGIDFGAARWRFARRPRRERRSGRCRSPRAGR